MPPPSIRSPGSTLLPSAEELAAVGRREAERLAAERRRAAHRDLERAVGRAGIPRRFRDRTFASYQADTPVQRHALAICRAYAEGFAERRRQGACLLLVGGQGTGKTLLACAILSTVIRAGHTGRFVSVPAALRLIREAYAPHGRRSETESFALLTAPDLLVLDELGLAVGSPRNRRAVLFDVLNTRCAEVRPTILIGNLTEAEMQAYLGERIMDRRDTAPTALQLAPARGHRRLGMLTSGEMRSLRGLAAVNHRFRAR